MKMKHRKFAYKWSAYKGIRAFRAENNAPHGRISHSEPYLKKDGSTGYRQFSRHCDCPSCFRYLQQIRKLNPDRYAELTEVKENTFFNKALPEHVHVRRRLGQAILKWR
jgi:hypothetical protein